MYVTSGIDPTGAKSAKHYLVIHYNSRRRLVKLPKSFSDLENQVKRLYNIKPGRFDVETEELNVCKGHRVVISREDWDDVAQMLGVIHIVPLEDSLPVVVDDHPESSPVDTIPKLAAISTSDNGLLGFDAPLTKNEFLVVNIGDIDFKTLTSSSKSKSKFQFLDESKNPVITVTINLPSGRITLKSLTNQSGITRPLKESFPLVTGHHVMLHKQDNTFVLLCDFVPVTSVQAPAHAPLTTVQYDLGDQSPFKVPISANVFTGLPDLRKRFGVYHSTFEATDKKKLLQQILRCQHADAEDPLETIRKEIITFKSSGLGIKWQSSTHALNQWADWNVDWQLQTQSIFVIRLDFTAEMKPQMMRLHLGPRTPRSLRIDISPQNEAVVSEYVSNNDDQKILHPSVKLPSPMQSPGKHSIALINTEKELHIVFDFRKSIAVPNTTILSRMPKGLLLQVYNQCSVDVDVFDFGR